MIPSEFLARLRCPIAPNRDVSLVQPDELHLLCPRCDVRFAIKEGFPVLVPEEAELPQGCAGLNRLPCQVPAKGPST